MLPRLVAVQARAFTAILQGSGTLYALRFTLYAVQKRTAYRVKRIAFYHYL